MANVPATAKAPQDHKTKKYEEIEITIGEGDDARVIPGRRVTVQGLTLTVQERALNDYRVVRLFAKNEMSSNIQALEMIIGSEQHDLIVEKFSDEDGFADSEAVGEFTMELFKALSPNS